MLPNANIVSLHRPIRQLMNEKWKISLRYFVTNMTIKPNDLKKLIEVYDKRLNDFEKSKFDLSVYNKNRMMNIINCIKPKKEEKDFEYPYKPLEPFECINYNWHDFFITYITSDMKNVNIHKPILNKPEAQEKK